MNNIYTVMGFYRGTKRNSASNFKHEYVVLDPRTMKYLNISTISSQKRSLNTKDVFLIQCEQQDDLLIEKDTLPVYTPANESDAKMFIAAHQSFSVVPEILNN